jgi:hypothetical protein
LISRHNARHVAVDVQQAVLAGWPGRAHFGEVDRRHRRAVVAVRTSLAATRGRCWPGPRASSRRCAGSGSRCPGRAAGDSNGSSLRFGLDREHVDGRADRGDPIRARRQRVEFDHGAARGVDQDARPSSSARFARRRSSLRGRRSGTCRDTTSAPSRSSSLPSWRALPSGSLVSTS